MVTHEFILLSLRYFPRFRLVFPFFDSSWDVKRILKHVHQFTNLFPYTFMLSNKIFFFVQLYSIFLHNKSVHPELNIRLRGRAHVLCMWGSTLEPWNCKKIKKKIKIHLLLASEKAFGLSTRPIIEMIFMYYLLSKSTTSNSTSTMYLYGFLSIPVCYCKRYRLIIIIW